MFFLAHQLYNLFDLILCLTWDQAISQKLALAQLPCDKF